MPLLVVTWLAPLYISELAALRMVEVGLLEVSIHGRPTNDMVAGEDAREMSVGRDR